MPRSKHHNKKQSDSKRRKLVNSRKAFKKYVNSPKREGEGRTMTSTELDNKLREQFPNLFRRNK